MHRAGSSFHQGLLGGELLEYVIQQREDQWAAYRERLEAMAAVTGDGSGLVAQGDGYFERAGVDCC